MSNLDESIDAAAAAVKAGAAVVYPTETVYGLGADGTDADAVERVFELKGRSRDKPLSIGVPDVDAAREYTRLTSFDADFMAEFLPGPVTVVVERGSQLPDVLTAGGDRVGVRVPDHEVALDFFRRADCPVTATSANRSGAPSVTHPDQLDATLKDSVGAVIDAGEAPGGTGSTVVDPSRNVIHRRGAMADAIETWLTDHVGESPTVED
ncbi:translation factor sua5 [Halogeometricum borinquense DSM 11551]|uniref:L-threonylcarbamoyladenylate synthase n=2 Tax=Halogeometricum borinquense TaxID=60847 RepID=E4NMH8_HALBP|nr:L-threonylcarbamoyladenylate synthase [Halogeometricum borinquense]ADQ68476.1 translation factor SUA5 [Halogeometricum borinquense DSM 11551]ELY27880.1 translation factor sua5 [Halogeometricum borinquense DSM 11551]RYJ14993.1 threonylcarbamoyl-AMP synthase [Halogeometricum borinquense]